MEFLNNLKLVWIRCRAVNSPLASTIAKYIYYRVLGKNILSSNRVAIYGIRNITTRENLRIGMDYVGFMHCKDRTLVRVKGRLEVNGKFSIGKGCRIDIGENASVSVNSGYINSKTNLVIMHGLSIGPRCAISWGCQFLDEDFHTLSYSGRAKATGEKIIIGSDVWIGCNVTVLKGSYIPNGCVVAAGSIVTSKFTEENVLIAGNPAKVVKKNVHWS